MRKTKRRDREEIIFAILKAAVVPTTRTRLIYASFLSGTELKVYVKLLIECGMLEPLTPDTKLVTTDAGRRFIRIYEDMENADATQIFSSKVSTTRLTSA